MTPEDRAHVAELAAIRAQADALLTTVDAFLVRYGPPAGDRPELVELDGRQCPHKNVENISGFGPTKRYHCHDCETEWEEAAANA